MLWTICVILLILWLLGLVSGYTLGGVIHILLVEGKEEQLLGLLQKRYGYAKEKAEEEYKGFMSRCGGASFR